MFVLGTGRWREATERSATCRACRGSVEGSTRGQQWDDDLCATRLDASLGASGFAGDLAPVAKRAENRREGSAPRRQTILHPRRYLMVNDSMDDAFRF